MATRTTSLVATNSSDANFRAWINEINTAITTFGWVQTSDTGQINFSTVTRPTGTNLYQGYAIYRMADSLQSTYPVYVRFDFGTCGTTDAPAFKYTVGTGTDGAGTITPIAGGLPVQFNTGTPVASASSFNCRSSGSTSAFRMVFWVGPGTVSTGWCFAIERDKDTSGADTANGVNLAHIWLTQNNGTASGGFGSSHIDPDGTYSVPDTNGWFCMVHSASSQTGGGNTGVGPVRVGFGPLRNPMLGLLCTARTDWTNESTNSITIYGGSHTYLMLRVASAAINLNRWNTDMGVGILWE